MSAMTITKNNFQEEVLQSSVPVLLDFWASWCGPCRMVAPVLEEIAAQRPDIKVGKINVDEQPELAQAFQVMSIPTLVVMKDGKVTAQSVGARPKNQILAMLCFHTAIETNIAAAPSSAAAMPLSFIIQTLDGRSASRRRRSAMATVPRLRRTIPSLWK